MTTAKDLNRDRSRVIAVIGDGSMTAGMAFEGLNHAGHLDKDLIVILNDNEMSISPNVGAMSSFLSRKLTGKTMSGSAPACRGAAQVTLLGRRKYPDRPAQERGEPEGFFYPGHALRGPEI